MFLFLLSLLHAGGTWAGALEDGLAAYSAKHYVTAFQLLKPLAERGNSRAQFVIGDLCVFEAGISCNTKSGIRWLTASAAKGNSDAQDDLGTLYYEGSVGVSQNYTSSLRWLRASAVQGNSKAQELLSSMYRYGLGVQKSNVHAYMWLSVVLAHGDAGVDTVNDSLETEMTPAQIAKAKALALKCMKSKYRQCGEP